MGSLGCVHTKPPLSLWQLDGQVHQDVGLPSPCDGRTDSQEDACGAGEQSCSVSSGGGFQQQIKHASALEYCQLSECKIGVCKGTSAASIRSPAAGNLGNDCKTAM